MCRYKLHLTNREKRAILGSTSGLSENREELDDLLAEEGIDKQGEDLVDCDPDLDSDPGDQYLGTGL